jgi:hypothetical protein
LSYASIEDLRSQLGAPAPASQRAHSPEYVAKMMHALPEGKEVERATFILERVKGKRVLEFGATGPMHDAVVKAAALVHGVDRPGTPGAFGFDLDDVSQVALPGAEIGIEAYDLVLCGEVLEHLSNPGWFLTRLARQYPTVPVLITVPNAFTQRGRGHLAKGLENVNVDHCSWYSPRTLRTLLERVGYEIKEFAWYGGAPPYSEGLIVVAEIKEA